MGFFVQCQTKRTALSFIEAVPATLLPNFLCQLLLVLRFGAAGFKHRKGFAPLAI